MAADSRSMVNRDKELWALALWVEKRHGANGSRFIAGKVGKFALEGEQGGVGLWREVADRFNRLNAGLEMPHGAS